MHPIVTWQRREVGARQLDDHIVVVDDERGVAHHGERAGAHRVIDAGLDLVETERVSGVRRAGRTPGLSGSGDQGEKTDGDDKRKSFHATESTIRRGRRWPAHLPP